MAHARDCEDLYKAWIRQRRAGKDLRKRSFHSVRTSQRPFSKSRKPKEIIMNPDEIVQFLSTYFKIDAQTLTAPFTHNHNDLHKREKHICRYLVYHLSHMNLTHTAKYFKMSDHTVILNTLEKVNNWKYPGIQRQVRNLTDKLLDIKYG